MSSRLEGIAWAAAIVLMLGVGYETLVATGVLAIGDVPGEGAPGGGVVLTASLLAYLVGAGASFVRGVRAGRERMLVWPLLPVAGAACMVAHWTSFDPYYAPTFRRYSEGGVAHPWILGVLIGAGLAAGIAALLPRLGAALGGFVLLVEALTVFVMPFGK